jgi:uncharacterized protein YjbJ (UPF0337 family)
MLRHTRVLKGAFVNRDVFKKRWAEIKGDIRSWWSDLTDEDVESIKGDSEKLIGKLQERYLYGRERAEQELNDFLGMPDGERRTA